MGSGENAMTRHQPDDGIHVDAGLRKTDVAKMFFFSYN
jgi:hypothetical protein